MTKALERDAIYLKRHFDAEIIVLCVRWYVTYKLKRPGIPGDSIF
jgi:transposase-like protein